MFALFELAKLLQFSVKGQNKIVKILNNTCHEINGKASLALYFSNGYLLLWHCHHGEQPVVRQISWFPNRHILSLCFDPSAAWLLACVRDALVIVPATALLAVSATPYGPWSQDDVTEIKLPKLKGQVSSCKWWQSSNEDSIAVLATDAGHLYLINLVSEQIVHEVRMEEHISNIAVVQDTTHACTCVLISTKSNIQWKLVLEQRVNTPQISYDSELVWKKKGAAPVIKFHRQKRYISILDKSEESSLDMTPEVLYQFPPSVILSTQQAKQQALVASFDLLTNVFQHNNQSVIQEFDLGPEEFVVSFYKHTFSDHLWSTDTTIGHSLWLDSLDEHTVLDGCLVITNKALYVCRPRVSPEAVFLSLVYDDEAYSEAERLAYILSLDLNLLFKLAASRCLTDGDCLKATVLMQRARCPHLEQLELFVRHGFIRAAMPVLETLMGGGSAEMGPVQCGLVAKYAVMCYVHGIAHGNTTLKEEFRRFLYTNYYLEKTKVLQILLNTGLHDYYVDFAQERDAFMEAIKLLLNYRGMEDTNLECDAPDPYTMVHLPLYISEDKQLIRDLLQLLDAHELVSLLDDNLAYAKKFTNLFKDKLSALSELELLNVATMLDIYKSPWKRWLHHAMSNDDSFSSGNSDDELGTYVNEEKLKTQAIGGLISLFVCALVHLNCKRGPPTDLASLSEVTDYIKPKHCPRKAKPRMSEAKEYVVNRPTVLACGTDFTAFVRNGDLYTWGSTQHGRLGLGNWTKDFISTPQAVKLFPELNTRVISVACGGKHCLALTEKGVYSWGSNSFGQLGNGTSTDSFQPVHLSTFDSKAVTAVVCGQYHSLVLTADFRVYSWGWGVHGQLGHGDSEDCPTPVAIPASYTLQTVMIAAGCMHSVLLTRQGEVYTFGCSNFGQLGTGQTHKATNPVLVNTLPEPIAIIASRYFHNLALSVDGKLYCWGSSPVQLRRRMVLVRRSKEGTRRSNQQNHNKHLLPAVIYTKDIKGKIIKLCCGSSHSAVLTSHGEVYTWGVNSDGQLATGNKLEEPTPNLVTSLNDTRIVALAAGHSFMVALDNCGELHGWGNNDKGQLGVRPRNPALVGHRTSNSLPGLLGRSHLRLMMDTNSVVDPVRVDGGSLSRVRNLRRYKEELTRAATPQEWWLEKLVRSPSPISSDRNLTDLAGPGPVFYPLQAVLHLATHLPHWCRHQELLDLSVRLEDWQMATRLALHEHNYNEALAYHLKLIAAAKDLCETSLEDIILGVVRQYVVLHVETDTDALIVLCELVLNFWNVHFLAVKSLQELVVEFESRLALPMFLVLVRGEPGETFQTMADKFEVSFLLQILQRAMQNVDRTKSKILEQYVERVLPGAMTSSSANRTQSQGTPADRTNQKIIHISKDALTSLLDQTRTQSQETTGNSSVRMSLDGEAHREMVAFSCGHHCNRDVLLTNLIPELEKKLVLNEPPMEQTASLLVEQYRCSDRLTMGCPECVYTALMKV